MGKRMMLGLTAIALLTMLGANWGGAVTAAGQRMGVRPSAISFYAAVNYAAGGNPRGVVTADFNRDGKLDLAIADSSGTQASFLRGNGNGTFQPRSNISVGAGQNSIAVADLNVDQNPDLVFATLDGLDIADVLGNGNGTFGVSRYFSAGYAPAYALAADLTGDAIPDVAASTYTGTVGVLRGLGTGYFAAVVTNTIGEGSYPRGLAAGLINADNFTDLVSANSASTSTKASLLLGNGNANFQPAISITVGMTNAAPYWPALGDLNGDGHLDLVVANRGLNQIAALLGDGSGGFGAPITASVGQLPQFVALADFNGDGILDAVTANYSDNNVSALQGVGDGTFMAAANFAVETGPIGLTVGDFDGNGSPDLAVVNYNFNSVSILLNTYNPTTPTVTPTPTITPTSSPTNTPTRTPTNTPTHTPTHTPTNTPTATNTPTPTDTATPTVTNTPRPTSTPGGPSETPTDTPTITDTPSATATPTVTPSVTGTSTATNTEVASPTATLPALATPSPTDCANPFIDLGNNVFYPAIHYLYCRGVVNGVDATHYGPSGTSTRAQFAKVVVLGFGIAAYTPGGNPDFTDVPRSYFAFLYIESGYHAGILSGFDPTSCSNAGATYPCYLPNRAITRAQLTKLVVGAAHYPPFTPTTPTFVDVGPSNIFYASIETAHHMGVINGYADNTFRPNNNIRRDEMAQVVYKGVTTP